MALKDWKRVSSDPVWQNKKTGVRVDIDKADISGGWWLMIYETKPAIKKLQKDIKFATKTQALAYARKYMRSH